MLRILDVAIIFLGFAWTIMESLFLIVRRAHRRGKDYGRLTAWAEGWRRWAIDEPPQPKP